MRAQDVQKTYDWFHTWTSCFEVTERGRYITFNYTHPNLIDVCIFIVIIWHKLILIHSKTCDEL